MILILLLFQYARSHSWIICSDYRADITSNVYDASKCSGIARGWDEFNQDVFGADRGFNYRITDENQPACIRDYRQDMYNSKFPMAQYNTGQSVRLIWPSKNHVAATCTNPYIPDTSLKLYVGEGYKNPTLKQVQQLQLVKDFKNEGNKKGFQNCPYFCDNMDKAICFQDFTVPHLHGPVTFYWVWEFNKGEIYGACIDAYVATHSPSPTPLPTSSPTPSPPPPSPSPPAPAPPAPAPSPASSAKGMRCDCTFSH